MTTLQISGRDLNVSLGFFVLVLIAIAMSAGLRGNTGVAVVALIMATAVLVAGFVMHRRPRPELRISPTSIELWSPGQLRQAIGREAAGGQVSIFNRIHRGRAFLTMSTPAGEPVVFLDGFDRDSVHAACAQHGWSVDVVG